MDKLLRFVEFTQEFRAIQRKIVMAKEKRNENDAEHSFQLALVAWYLISTETLRFDVSKCIKYALVHDLVEVYAGDTPSVHRGYEKERQTKKKREADAFEKIKKEFAEFQEMLEYINQYELKLDEESKFIYALDKVLPMLNIYLDEGYSWKMHNIKFEDIIEDKKNKVSLSPEVEKYFNQIANLLMSKKDTLFKEYSEN